MNVSDHDRAFYRARYDTWLALLGHPECDLQDCDEWESELQGRYAPHLPYELFGGYSIMAAKLSGYIEIIDFLEENSKKPLTNKESSGIISSS